MSNKLDWDGLNETLSIIEDELPEISSQNPITAKGETDLTTYSNGKVDVNVSEMYAELNKLMDVGKRAMASASYILESTGDAESISGVATMLTSLKQILGEYNKIHLMNLKFEQQKEFEQIKFNNRMKAIAARNSEGEGEDIEDLLAYNTDNIIEAVLAQESN